MAFRRIIITTDKTEDLKKELERLFKVTKNDFPELKHQIIKGAKEGVTIIDLSGEGADSFANKVKDSGTKVGATAVKIRKEKKLSPMKESKIKQIVKETLGSKTILGRGMSKAGLAADMEQMDREYYSKEARERRELKKANKLKKPIKEEFDYTIHLSKEQTEIAHLLQDKITNFIGRIQPEAAFELGQEIADLLGKKGYLK